MSDMTDGDESWRQVDASKVISLLRERCSSLQWELDLANMQIQNLLEERSEKE